MVQLMTVDGDHVTHLEILDESDIDVALAKFDELTGPAQHLNNAASQVIKRIRVLFAARDWSGMRGNLAENFLLEDRRRTVNGGISHGRDTTILDLRAAVDVGFTDLAENVVALRGERLVLTRARYSGNESRPEPYFTDVLHILEIDADQKLVAAIVFDHDDTDAAFDELDARFIAGEGAAHSHIWTLVSQTYARFNLHELSPTTPDWVNVDHRRGAAPEPGDMHAYVSAMWAVAPDVRTCIESVHRLTNLGAVFTHSELGTSQQGFGAEWHEVTLLTFEGDLIDRCELFDEDALDVAVARFDELMAQANHLAGAVTQLDNAATRVRIRVADEFNRRDMSAFLALAADGSFEDRRRGLRDEATGPGLIKVREALFEIAPTDWVFEVKPFALRGSRLALTHDRYRTTDQRPTTTAEQMTLTEIDDDGLVRKTILFDLDDTDAAFDELDARYLVGEAAAYAHTWSLVAQIYARFNRRELLPTVPNWESVDHRSGIASARFDAIGYAHAAWSTTPDVKAYVEAVHQLSNLGAVITCVTLGTSREGFAAEWRDIHLMTIEGDLAKRLELFDEGDLDAALARFEEFERPVRQLNNEACRTSERFVRSFATGDWDGLADTVARDFILDDRRRVVGAGVRHGRDAEIEDLRAFTEVGLTNVAFTVLAIRGERLVLSRSSLRSGVRESDEVHTDMLSLAEVDTDSRMSAAVLFDPDDIDSAFEELNIRYLAGEAAPHADVWSDVVRLCMEFNHREIPSATTEFVSIDHRRGTAFAPGELTEYLLATWDLSSKTALYIEEVHRLTHLGAVVTLAGKATSRDGFAAEWRVVNLFTFEGHLLSRVEIFDDFDIDVALANFDELSVPASLQENAVTAVLARVVDAFNRRDIDSYLALFCDDGRYEDRRKGLRDVGPIKPDYARAIILEAGTGWQEEIECIAVRGTHLLLCRAIFRDHGEADRPIAVEALVLAEVTGGGLISAFVTFDPDDIDAALAELTARWIASGEVEHPDVIEAMGRLFDASNRHDWDALAAIEAGATFVNHRQLGTGEKINDHWSSLRMMASLIPDMRVDVADIPRHSAIGVVTNLVVKGTTVEGAAIELPAVIVLLFDNTRVARMEAFDLGQRDQALARFQELHG
jgi:hypothetical protein